MKLLTSRGQGARDSTAFVDALVTQSDDGCSLGGIESLLAAERGEGIIAAVHFAGASATWATNTPLQERMKLAASDPAWGDEVLAFLREATR